MPPPNDPEAQSLINLGAYAVNSDAALSDPGLVPDAVALLTGETDPEQTANTASLTADQTNIAAGYLQVPTVEQSPGAAAPAAVANRTVEVTATNQPPVIT